MMDKEIAEIREGLAELINDVDYLLNLHTGAPFEPMPLTAFEPNAKLYEVMQRVVSIQGEVNFLMNKLNEHLDQSKKKRKGRYL